ncbi:MAG: site-specific DNA-methyltransferase [Proteobacteria bacterium]|nr:site-specific DNA-methyltransferase [Pseudomonadota bacterium]
MTERKQKLELTWIGKENRPRLEPRILLDDQEKSYHAQQRISEKDIFDNRLIFGDNLLALKALEQEFAGKIKCIFIDPPYNTGSAFTHYDDGIEHSIWLSLMRDRLELLRTLLSDDGSIWITIDDNEGHYLKVLLDEVFGRGHFIGSVTWEKSDSPRMDAQYFSSRHDYVLVYGKNRDRLVFNKPPNESKELADHYDKIDNEGRPYYLKPLRAMGGQGDSRMARPKLFYALVAPDGTNVFPRRQDGSDGAWRWSPEKVEREKDRIEWKKGRNGWNPYFRIYGDGQLLRPAETIWFHSEVGSNRTSKAEVKALISDLEQFETPKPERLLKRVIDIASSPDDIVLDSFAGSGTTGAVAHKMGRRWIMVELGEHCHTHIIPRMKKVIDGEDPGGITKVVDWKGGGGFRYFRLAPSLLEKDKWGNWVISKEYNATMLASAMAKHEGFVYNPDETFYWKQGKSTEKDYIFTTTNFITVEYLDSIHEEMQPDESLLICCKSFQEACEDRYENITIKKIPNLLLGRCEFGKEDYSLNIANEIQSDAEPVDEKEHAADKKGKTGKKKGPANQPALFDKEGE